MNQGTRNRLTPTARKLLAVTIGGLLTTYTLAQSESEFDPTTVDTSAEFNELDTNQNDLVEWSDIQETMEPRLKAADLNARETFDQYDEDKDNALDEQEFRSFILSVRETEYDQESFSTDRDSTERSAAAAGYLNRDEDRAGSESDTSYGATDAEGAQGSATTETGRSTVNSAAGGEFATEDTITERDSTTEETEGSPSRPGNPAVHSAAGGEFRAGAGSTSADEPVSAQQPSSRDPYITEGDETRRQERQANYDPASSQKDLNSSEVREEPIGQAEYTSRIPQALTHEPISSLTDRRLRTTEGDKIGKVDDVVVNRTNGEVGLVVSSGGVLGIGERQFLAPIEELSLVDDELIWNTTLSKKELRESHNYQPDDFVVITEQYETLGELQPGGLSRR